MPCLEASISLLIVTLQPYRHLSRIQLHSHARVFQTRGGVRDRTCWLEGKVAIRRCTVIFVPVADHRLVDVTGVVLRYE